MSTELDRARWRRASAKYGKTAKGRANRDRYNHSPKGRDSDARFRATEGGKIYYHLKKRTPAYMLQRRLYMQVYRERI